MNDDINYSLTNEDYGFDILKEIEDQTSDNIRRQRSSERLVIKAKIILQPGNTSECLNMKMLGISGDISSGGCRAMFPAPLKIGDIYRLYFDRDVVDIPMVFARCMRCKLISEDSFETGFSFFTRVILPETIESEENISLI